MKVSIIFLLPLVAILSGCSAQRHNTSSTNQVYEESLATLESQRFVIEIDEVYGKKGKRADAHQSYVRMKGTIAEVSFAPDFFRLNRTGGNLSHYSATDESSSFEKLRVKRNDDVQFQIQGRLDWRKMGGRCLITLYHDSNQVYLNFFDYLNRPFCNAKSVVLPLKE